MEIEELQIAKQPSVRREEREAARLTLDRYRSYCIIHERMLSLIEIADAKLTSMTSQLGETRSSGAAHDSIGDSIAALHERRDSMKRIDEDISRALDDMLRIVLRVSEMDSVAGGVLSRRYMVAGKPPEFSDIAEQMGYSEDHVKRKHGDGLDMAYMIIAQ